MVEFDVVMKWMEYIRNNPENAYRFTENFWQSQVDSKKWLLEHIPDDVNVICIFGGWYGILAQFISDKFPFATILTTDVDPAAREVFDAINTNPSIFFEEHDMGNGMPKMLPYPQLVINTSSEHVSQEVYDAWWNAVKPGTKYIVQGNNLENVEHVRLAENLEHFLEINRIENPDYAGMLKCGHFYRFMAVGVK